MKPRNGHGDSRWREPENTSFRAWLACSADHRDCHVKPDSVPIYRKPDDDTLQLARLGSHAELGGDVTACDRCGRLNCC
jgi:hypothetical protein